MGEGVNIIQNEIIDFFLIEEQDNDAKDQHDADEDQDKNNLLDDTYSF